MTADIKLQFDDLHHFLTDEDYKQIDEFPSPSLEQAQMMMRKWEDYFGAREVPKTREGVIHGIIWLKPYLKIKQDYPELFL